MLIATSSHSVCHSDSCAHSDWFAGLPHELQQAAQENGLAPAQVSEKDQERHRKDIQGDIELGKEYAALVEKELPLSDDKEAITRLTAIGAEIAETANTKHVAVLWGDGRFSQFQYTFKLVKGDDVNAFSLPGGFIYVYEGLMKFAESDDEVASVLAHEVAHASFRHLAVLRREQSKLDIFRIPLLIAAIMSRSSDAMAGLTAAEYATQGMVSGWTVKAETSADYGAVQYLVDSRYNPIGMLTFMERLAMRDRYAPKVDWGIYQTHPPSQDRAKFLMKTFNDLRIPIRRSQVTTSLSAHSVPVENDFELRFGGQKLYTFRGPDAKDRAARALLATNAFLDSVPQMFQFTIEDDQVKGNGRVLFVIEDLDLKGQPKAEASKEIASAFRKAIFDLNYRLWSM